MRDKQVSLGAEGRRGMAGKLEAQHPGFPGATVYIGITADGDICERVEMPGYVTCDEIAVKSERVQWWSDGFLTGAICSVCVLSLADLILRWMGK